MSLGAYLAGSFGTLAGLACVLVVASVLRGRLLPGWSGPPAWTATAVLATGTALGVALALGSFGLLTGWSWLLLAALLAFAAWRWRERLPAARARAGLVTGPGSGVMNAVGAAVAAGASGAFVAEVSIRLGTGMTGFDSTWYHGPFASGMAQSGDTFSLQLLAPQFLSWFYPQNSELVHALGVSAFGTDLLSIFINLGWFAGCLVAGWCIGRPYGAAPVSLAGVALIVGSSAMADQAGEARNDIVGTFFVLAALAVILNAAAGGRRLTLGPVLVIALAGGLAAGTKVNFIPAGLVLLVAVVVLSDSSRRLRNGVAGAGVMFLGGGYWYLRNLIHAGNPLPWIDHLGPLSLPGPDQDVGGRDAGSVWDYLTDAGVIRDWFVPGFEAGFGAGWILLMLLGLAGLVLCLGRQSGPARRAGAVVGLALVFAWLVAPTSASGPAGEPNGFVSGLRYLAPALAVCLALLGSGVGQRGNGMRWLALGLIAVLAPVTVGFGDGWSLGHWLLAAAAGVLCWLALLLSMAAPGLPRLGRGPLLWAGALAAVLLIFSGNVVQRYYFDHRYASPDFTIPALAEAFVWANGTSGEAIGTNATRQYPLWGRDLDNEVQFIGVERPHGGFVEPESCEQMVEAVNAGGYDYLVLSLDRESPRLSEPRELTWIIADPAVEPVSAAAGGAVLRVTGPLAADTCH